MNAARPRRLLHAAVVAAMAATALTAAGTAPATAAVACQRTFTSAAAAEITRLYILPNPSGDLPTIAEGSGQSVVEVPAGGTIADLDVTVHITHPFANRLALSLEQAGGATLVLKDKGGSAGADFAGTTFDDEATQPIGLGTGPFAGRFRPVEPLSGYDGVAAAGSWTLLATNWEEAPGTIDSWSVTVTYAGSCDDDADGVEDHADRCLGVTGRTASGCPTAARTLTAAYRKGTFRGVLASPVARCKATRSVTVWKLRAGPDRKVGTATTRPDGTYRLARAKKPGRYYATAARVLVPGVAECLDARSARFRVR